MENYPETMEAKVSCRVLGFRGVGCRGLLAGFCLEEPLENGQLQASCRVLRELIRIDRCIQSMRMLRSHHKGAHERKAPDLESQTPTRFRVKGLGLRV